MVAASDQRVLCTTELPLERLCCSSQDLFEVPGKICCNFVTIASLSRICTYTGVCLLTCMYFQQQLHVTALCVWAAMSQSDKFFQMFDSVLIVHLKHLIYQ